MNFFDRPDALADLERIAEGWLGTPFVEHGRVRGYGCSCETLPVCIYQACGLLPDVWPIPVAPTDWHLAKRESVMAPFIDGRPEFRRVHKAEAQPGDLLGFRVHRVLHHLGILLSHHRFVHCLRPRGVQLSDLRDASYLRHLEVVWRPCHG